MNQRVCLTPNAKWTTEIHPGSITVKVTHQSLRSDVPGCLGFTKAEAQKIERELHDAIEGVLAKQWTADNLEYAALKNGKFAASERK